MPASARFRGKTFAAERRWQVMNDPRFQIELRWSGTGRDGAGEILTDDLTLELSVPQAMGGRGVGTNPEELLVTAVSSCYTATLSAEAAPLATTSGEARPLRKRAAGEVGLRSPDVPTARAST
jgi:peroxiredoxin-like protein